MITAQILSPYGWTHYESQKQDDGKEALVLVTGDMRQSYAAQAYNGRYRSWTDILALPSEQVKGCAVIEIIFDETRTDDMKALAEITADALCVRLDAGKVADVATKVATITKCDVKALDAKSATELKASAITWLKAEAAKPVEVKPVDEAIEPIDAKIG